MAGEQAERGSLSASFIKGRSTRYPNTTRTNLFGTELRMVVTLAAGAEPNFSAEPATIRQRYTRAVHAFSKSSDRHDLAAPFNLALCHFESHERIIPRPTTHPQGLCRRSRKQQPKPRSRLSPLRMD